MNGRLVRTVGSAVAVQANWFACVLSAAAGLSWIGFLTVGIWIVVFMKMTGGAIGELGFIAALAGFGLVVETLIMHLGAYEPMAEGAMLTPTFMIVLWANFATVWRYCLDRLDEHFWLAAVFGLVGGPLSYWGGVQLGAPNDGPYGPLGLWSVALLWALVTPGILLLRRRLGLRRGGDE